MWKNFITYWPKFFVQLLCSIVRKLGYFKAAGEAVEGGVILLILILAPKEVLYTFTCHRNCISWEFYVQYWRKTVSDSTMKSSQHNFWQFEIWKHTVFNILYLYIKVSGSRDWIKTQKKTLPLFCPTLPVSNLT